MSGVFSEDAQPNEARSSRKGVGVPAVRSFGARHTPQGPRGRGRPFPPRGTLKQLHPVNSSDDLSVGRSGENSQSETRRGTNPALFVSHEGRPAKRQKVEGNPDSSQGKDMPGSLSHPQPKTKTRDKEKYLDLVVPLPGHCRKGAPNCNRLRQKWIDKKKNYLEDQYGAKLLRHAVMEDRITFTFLLESPPRLKSPDANEGGEALLPTGQIYSREESSMASPARPTSHEISTDSTKEVHTTSLPARPEKSSQKYRFDIPPDVEIIDLTDDTCSIEAAAQPVQGQDLGPTGPSVERRNNTPASNQVAASCSRANSCRAIFVPTRFVSTTVRIHPPLATCDNGYMAAPSISEVTCHAASTNNVSKPLHLMARPSSSSSASGYSISGYRASVRSPPDRGQDIVALPKHQHDKPRRMLLPTTGHESTLLYAVSMHGFICSIDVSQPSKPPQSLRIPEDPWRESIDDACILNTADRTVMILGHARDRHQVSVIQVAPGKAANSVTLDRPSRPCSDPGKRHGTGISAVCALRRGEDFVTGSYDHQVHVWSLRNGTSSIYSAPKLLNIKHTSAVQSLVCIRDTSHKVVTASADCSVNLWDLSSERVVRTIKVSNSVYHVHELENPFCTLLEIGHREQQFEIRDHRLVPEKPVQRFGYASLYTHGRYIKGDIRSSKFACGDREGTVRLWDLRNTQGTPLAMSCFPGCKIVQVAFQGSDSLIVCSDDSELATIDYRLTRPLG